MTIYELALAEADASTEARYDEPMGLPRAAGTDSPTPSAVKRPTEAAALRRIRAGNQVEDDLKCHKCGGYYPPLFFQLNPRLPGRRFRAIWCNKCQADYRKASRAKVAAAQGRVVRQWRAQNV